MFTIYSQMGGKLECVLSSCVLDLSPLTNHAQSMILSPYSEAHVFVVYHDGSISYCCPSSWTQDINRVVNFSPTMAMPGQMTFSPAQGNFAMSPMQGNFAPPPTYSTTSPIPEHFAVSPTQGNVTMSSPAQGNVTMS